MDNISFSFKQISFPVSYEGVVEYLRKEAATLRSGSLVAILSPKNEIHTSERSRCFILFPPGAYTLAIEETLTKIARTCEQFSQETRSRQPEHIYLAVAKLSKEELISLMVENVSLFSGDAQILCRKLKR